MDEKDLTPLELVAAQQYASWAVMSGTSRSYAELIANYIRLYVKRVVE